MPDDTTLCRRQKTLTVQIPYRRADGPLNLLVDSGPASATGSSAPARASRFRAMVNGRRASMAFRADAKSLPGTGLLANRERGCHVDLAMDKGHFRHPRCGVYAQQRW